MALASISEVAQPEHSAGLDTLLSGVQWAPTFPAAWAVPLAAATLYDAAAADLLLSRRPAGGDCPEGPAFFVTVSPGSVRIRRLDLAAGERTAERARGRSIKRQDEGAGWMRGEAERLAAEALADGGLIGTDQVPEGRTDPLSPGKARSRIVAWSAKSRANMTARLCTLDYAPLVDGDARLAMVTATLPGDWLRFAPTGSHFKALVRRLGKRFERAWGAPLVGVWKLEFQDRGAPHLHILTAPPRGRSRDGRLWRDWFAESWADVLGVSGAERDDVVWVHRRVEASANYAEGLRCTDPRRVAVYFTKHGLLAQKEYQHVVPVEWQEPGAGPGRFWGYWGLQPVEESVQVTHEQAVRLARVARKWNAAQRGTRIASVWRSSLPGIPFAGKPSGLGVPEWGEVGAVRYRKRRVKRRVKRLRGTWGFLAANDGPGLGLMLASALRT